MINQPVEAIFNTDFSFSISVVLIFLTSFLLKKIITQLWEVAKEEKEKKIKEVYKLRDSRHPQLVGIVENIIYFLLFIVGRPEGIAVWLTFKTIPIISYWKDKPTRDLYNIFIIGNGLSILNSIFIYFIFIGLSNYNYDLILSVATVYGLFLFAIWLLIHKDNCE